jgi:phosphoribosylglycinamide formyltransferase-1
MNKLNLGFLASHGGSNMQAIIENVKNGKLSANLCAMVSNNKKSFALERAKKENIPCFVINDITHSNKTDEEIVRIFKTYNVDTVILAGYMKIVSKYLIDNFNGRILNIHPALLPKFGGKGMYGMNVHKAVIEAKETISGATIHLVNTEYDSGKILQQMKVPVIPDDTPETLAERVLNIEHQLYTDTLIKISSGKIII